MDEVIKLESRIRAAMSKARDQAPIELVTEAIAIMPCRGGPRRGPGSTQCAGSPRPWSHINERARPEGS
jgi:hypothetical protein